jgi:hypothetical protein
VNREMNPCHKPAQKPAGSAANFSFPGAQDDRTRNNPEVMIRAKKVFFFFMVKLVLLIRMFEFQKYEISGKWKTVKLLSLMALNNIANNQEVYNHYDCG